MNMKKRLGAAITAVALAFVGLSLVASPAQATQTSGDKCTPADATYREVLVTEAWDETVVVEDAYWQRYSWTGGPLEEGVIPEFPSEDWQANVKGDPHDVGEEGAYYVSHGSSGNADWFYLELVDGVTETIHHPAVYESQLVKDAILCEWHTWDTGTWNPDAEDAGDVGWPQEYVGPGRIAPTECELTYQQDLYRGTRAEIDDVLDGGILDGPNPPEDHLIVKDWKFASSDECLGLAVASWVGTAPSCLDLDGSGEFTFENASVTSATRAGDGVDYAGGFTAGTHNTPFAGEWTVTLTANEGFAFGDESTTKVLVFTIAHLNLRDCVAEPEPDSGDDVVTTSECTNPLDGTVVTTTTTTSWTQGSTWDERAGEWVPADKVYGEPVVTVVTSEDAECIPEPPAPLVGTDAVVASECVVPADGTEAVTTTSTSWTQGHTWDSEAGEYVLGEKVYAEPVVTVEVVKADLCAPPSDPPALSETGFEGMGGVYGSAGLLLVGLALLVARRQVSR